MAYEQLADAVSDQLGALGASLRVQGSRVGLGELLTAHRALEAVDCTSREDARLALRAVLCSERGDLPKFEQAFHEVFGDGSVPLGPSPFDDLSEEARAALPHAGVPATGVRTPHHDVDGTDIRLLSIRGAGGLRNSLDWPKIGG